MSSRRNLLARLAYLILGWGTVGIIYQSSTQLQGQPRLLQPSIIDDLITFSPHAIWPYLSFFIIIPLSYLSAPYPRVRWMSFCFMLTAVMAGLSYTLYPTTMVYPSIEENSVSLQLLGKLSSIDVPLNCCPSLHVALTTFVVWGAINIQRPGLTTLWIVWGVWICFSTIQLRRHLFIDVASGFILALLVGYFMWYLLNKRAPFAATLPKQVG